MNWANWHLLGNVIPSDSALGESAAKGSTCRCRDRNPPASPAPADEANLDPHVADFDDSRLALGIPIDGPALTAIILGDRFHWGGGAIVAHGWLRAGSFGQPKQTLLRMATVPVAGTGGGSAGKYLFGVGDVAGRWRERGFGRRWPRRRDVRKRGPNGRSRG